MSVRSLAVVIPVLERDIGFLHDLLAAIALQDCQPTEIIVSTDVPQALIIEKSACSQVRVVHNPNRAIAHALNLAIQSTDCELIVRFDARARPPSNYIRRCVETLENEIEVVGGHLCIYPGNNDPFASAIALALGHPLGAGDARYRIGGQKGEVDTIPYPCFRRSLWEKLGGYNEELEANEDYEFNWRVRQLGGRILFDPSIQCGYVARPSLRELAEQYFRYGWWKMKMLIQHPRSIRWRQALPLAAPVLVFTTALLGVFWPWVILFAIGWVLAYFGLLAWNGIKLAFRRRSPLLAITFPLAVLVIHSAWGTGAWMGLLTRWRGLTRRLSSRWLD